MRAESALPHPKDFPWSEINKPGIFASQKWTRLISEGLSVHRPDTREFDKERQKVVTEELQKHFPICVDRLRSLEESLCSSFSGKDDIIRMVIVSAIAQQPMLIVGPPGTGKSRIITRFCEGLGIDRVGEGPEGSASEQGARLSCFQYLLHGFTEPEEVLGLLNLAALKDPVQPRFARFRKGSIIDSEVVFLDEVFRANSAILNALLSIVNERRLYEGGVAHPAKAKFIFGASNAIPEPHHMKELQAFYERFIVRMVSDAVPLGSTSSEIPPARKLLLEYGWKSEVSDLRGGYVPRQSAIEPVACLNDVLFCNRAITELWGAEDLNANPAIKKFVENFHTTVQAVANRKPEFCSLDDRKFIKLFLLARAHALYTHKGPPSALSVEGFRSKDRSSERVSDLEVLKHIWNTPEDRHQLKEEVQRRIDRGY